MSILELYISEVSMVKGALSRKFLFIVLPVAIIPMLLVALFISNNFYTYLKKQNYHFYMNLIMQVSNNVDFIYQQYAMSLTDIVMMDNFQKIINHPPFKTSIEEANLTRKMGERGHPKWGSIRRTISSKINGEVFLVELDRKSLITNMDYKITRFSGDAMSLNIEKLIIDPSFELLEADPSQNLLLVKPGSDVIVGFNAQNKSILLFPCTRNSKNKILKFIVVILEKDFIPRLYNDIDKLHFGTLFILDWTGNVISSNHPGENDYYVFDKSAGKYIIEDGDEKIDPFSGISFSDYNLLVIDYSILQNPTLQDLLSKENRENEINNNIDEQGRQTIKWNNRQYMVVLEHATFSHTRYIFLHPVQLMKKPINIVQFIAVGITVVIMLLTILLIYITGKIFAKPIERKTTELESEAEKLEKLDRLKNEFIANITHDFRSPLTVILNKSDLVIKFRKKLPKDIKSAFELIYDSSLRLKHSIDKLLDLARMDTLGVKLQIQKIDPVPFINDVINYYISSLSDAGITIIKKIPDHVIDDFYSDLEKLEEVINNIISNAIKFTECNTGVITVELVVYEGYICFKISDNGIGIAPDKIETIFDRFEQIDEGRDSVYKGTGIGLSFSRQLIGFLHGEIWAESEGLGTGSSFIIKLLRGKEHFTTDDFYDAESRYIHKKELISVIQSQISDKKDKKGFTEYIFDRNSSTEFDPLKSLILIVDDNRFVRELVKEYLEHNGYSNFILATDGEEALKAASRYLPDIFICDYNMPNMRGDVLHDMILLLPTFQFTPFIFLSAVINKTIVIERLQKGAVSYLLKPLDESELILTVNQHLESYMVNLKLLRSGENPDS